MVGSLTLLNTYRNGLIIIKHWSPWGNKIHYNKHLRIVAKYVFPKVKGQNTTEVKTEVEVKYPRYQDL